MDRIDILHAADHPAEHGIILVELELGLEDDEELAVGRIFRLDARFVVGVGRRALARRRHRAAYVRQVIELGGYVGKIRSAGAVALGIAGLRHEARSEEHTSELQSLIRISY